MIPFVKMHGCGNDFVLVREADLVQLQLAQPLADFIRRVCERRFGLGADGLIAYARVATDAGGSRLRMRYWNSDGSAAEMCGNGARCVIRLAYDRGESAPELELESDAGVKPARVIVGSTPEVRVEINMGAAIWEPEEVPVMTSHALVDETLEVAGENLRVSALSMGNPHAVVFVDNQETLSRVQLERLGNSLSEHDVFPQRANVSFVCVAGDELYARVWERGVGPTLACGTAACAVTAAADRLGRIESPAATVHQPGGSVRVRIETQGELWMSGPARYVAEGHLAEELCAEAGTE